MKNKSSVKYLHTADKYFRISIFTFLNNFIDQINTRFKGHQPILKVGIYHVYRY